MYNLVPATAVWVGICPRASRKAYALILRKDIPSRLGPVFLTVFASCTCDPWSCVAVLQTGGSEQVRRERPRVVLTDTVEPLRQWQQLYPFRLLSKKNQALVFKPLQERFSVPCSHTVLENIVQVMTELMPLN